MSDAEERGRWLDLGERIRKDPADFEAWNEALAMGRIVYEPSSEDSPGRFVVALDEAANSGPVTQP